MIIIFLLFIKIKIAIPCRPQKTFTLFVFDVPDDLPIEDIRHSLYRYNSVVEVVRLLVFYHHTPPPEKPSGDGSSTPKPQIPKLIKSNEDEVNSKEAPPPPVRITLASVEEFNMLLQNGLDFYGATFFPTEKDLPATAARIATARRGR